MTDIHLSHDLLAAAAEGSLSPQTLRGIERQHLLSLCPHCRKTVEDFRKEQQSGKDPAQALLLLPAYLKSIAPQMAKEESKARQDVRSLLALPPRDREARILRAKGRFRGDRFAKLLIQEVEQRIPGQPQEALQLAELAKLALRLSRLTEHGYAWMALATAHQANANRVLGDLHEANRLFDLVRWIIRENGVKESEALGRIDHLEGSLRMDQRRFNEAEELLVRAVMLYQVVGDSIGIARVLLTLGGLYFFQGHLFLAIETTQAALRGVNSKSQRRLYLYGRFNLARYLVEARDPNQAALLLAEDEARFAALPEPWTQLRLKWLKGKIALAQHDSVNGEALLIQAREGFVEQGVGYDAAMVSLEDLAPYYLSEGRTADVKRLAEEMFRIFQAQDVHREMVAALVLFQEAARREEITMKRVRALVLYMREARTEPALRFSWPKESP
jgi:tetratricopeptide (TPR) repeat protein